MIRLLEIDLERPLSDIEPSDGPTWVLVRAGFDVLGEVRFSHLDEKRVATLDQQLRELFADRLYAREQIRALAPDDPLPPSDVTVAVCTHDRPEHLEAWLRRAIALDPAPGEILVVDNAPSGDAARVLADRFGVRYEVEPAIGLNRARDAAWRATRTAVIAYVDDDARVDRGYVHGVARGFISPRIACVTGLTLPYEIRTAAQAFFERLGGMSKGFDARSFDASMVGFETHRLGAGANMAFRRDVLAELGGFDPRLDHGTKTRGSGDLDMFYRVLETGYVIRYEPRALVRHLHRPDTRGLLTQSVDWGIAYEAYLAKRAAASAAASRAVKRYRRRWRVNRHVRRILAALRYRRWLELPMAAAEAYGSLLGARAFAAEDGRAIANGGSPPDGRSWTAPNLLA